MWPIIFWLAILFLVSYRIFQIKDSELKLAGFLLLFIKIAASVLISWYYLSYTGKGGDILQFYSDALVIIEGSISDLRLFYASSMHSGVNFDTPRTSLFIKMLIPLVWISGKNFWLTSILTGVLSFSIPFFIFLRYQDVLHKLRYQLVLVFFILPSTLIWTSGIFKENIALLLLLLFLLPLFEYQKTRTVYRMPFYFWIVSILSFFLFIQLRYFIAILVIPVIGIIILSELDRSLKFKIGFALFVLSSCILFLFIHPVLNPNSLPHYLFDAHDRIMDSNSGVVPMYFQVEKRDWYSIFINIPHALENVFLRPYPWEWVNFGYVVYSIENYILILIVFSSLMTVREFNLWQLLILIILVVGLALISIATPNLGSLFRYRSLVMPFIVFLFAIHIPFERFIKRQEMNV